MNIATTGLTFFCVAWCLSSFVASPAFDVCGGLITPFLVVSGIALVDCLLGMGGWPEYVGHPPTWHPWWYWAAFVWRVRRRCVSRCGHLATVCGGWNRGGSFPSFFSSPGVHACGKEARSFLFSLAPFRGREGLILNPFSPTNQSPHP